jgi:hypothetical protein
MALEVKTAKNSKLPKLSENYFELVGKGGWPPISIWITWDNYICGRTMLFMSLDPAVSLFLWRVISTENQR